MRLERQDGSALYTTTIAGHEILCTFEVGDWLSFISSGRTGHKATSRTTILREDPQSFHLTEEITLRTGQLTVEDKEQMIDNGLERCFSVVGNAELGDFVGRFVFQDAGKMRAKINGRTFEHKSNDRYLQFNTNTVQLEDNDTTFRIQVSDVELPEGVELVCYVRDSPGNAWTVHVRALCTAVANGFLRLYRGPWNQIELLDNIIKRLKIDRSLLYLRERASGSPVWRFMPFAVPFQFVSTVPLSDTDGVTLSVTLEKQNE